MIIVAQRTFETRRSAGGSVLGKRYILTYRTPYFTFKTVSFGKDTYSASLTYSILSMFTNLPKAAEVLEISFANHSLSWGNSLALSGAYSTVCILLA